MKIGLYCGVILLSAGAGIGAAACGWLGAGAALSVQSVWRRATGKGFSSAGREVAPPAAPGSAFSPQEAAQKIRDMQQLLERKNAEIASLERALREFEGFRRQMPELQIRAAHVCGRTAEEALLDAGAENGVENGRGVVQGGVLAGIVAKTEPRQCTVLLTNHSGCLVPARGAKSRDICTIRGLGGQDAIAVFYANQTETSPGEKILTSGLLGKLPPGLIIGTVADYPHPAAGGTMEAPVRLEADFPALEHVLVVSPLKAPAAPAPPDAPGGKKR